MTFYKAKKRGGESSVKGNIVKNVLKETKGIVVKATVRKATALDGYRKRGQDIINRGLASGYEEYMRKILKTLDVDELVKSKQGLENLKRKMIVVREREGVEKANRKWEHNVYVEKAYKTTTKQMDEVRDSYGSKTLHMVEMSDEFDDLPHFEEFEDMDTADIKRSIKQMEMKRLITYVDEMADEKKYEFFKTYFMELRYDGDLWLKVEELSDSFKGNLSEFNDFTETICSNEFKRFYASDQEKINAQEYKDEMTDRLIRAIDIRNRSLSAKNKIKNIKI